MGGKYDTIQDVGQRLFLNFKVDRIPPAKLLGKKRGNNYMVYFSRSKQRAVPSPTHIQHELGVSKCFCAFYTACKRNELTFDWKRKPSLPTIFVPEGNRDDAKTPDHKFLIEKNVFFLEYETGANDLVRSDWSQTQFRGKICYYNALHDFVLKKKFEPFRILTICLDKHDMEKRRELVNRVLDRTLFKAKNLFWFADIHDLVVEEPYDPSPCLFSAIWKVPTSENPIALFEI